ncbi:MAG: hypothetical protein JWO11_4526, partial [Nocardioides sp.]|nr:hypothetical protein [Nocardioides sp.]
YSVTEDASYMGGSTVSLNSLSEEGAALLYNGMPDINKVTEIKLNVNSILSQDVTLNFTDLSAVGSFQIFLKDAYLNKVTDVKLNRSYAFTIDKKIAATFGANRFSLVFKAPIPVKILNFTANKVKTSSEIKWVTENEANTDHFDVERSLDKVTFQKIASISKPENELGATTSAYNYTDHAPQVGVNYYRLRQVDMQGKFTFTDTLSLSYEKIEEAQKDTFKFSIYPNPTINELRVKLADRTDRAITMSVYNMQGLKLKNTIYEAEQELLQNVSDLLANMYILEVRDSKSDKLLGTAKFIKQ